MTKLKLLTIFGCGMAWLSACAESTHQTRPDPWRPALPPDLERQLDTSVEFPALKAAPEQYVGRVVMFGGIVLSARRTPARTEIEILELPLQDGAPQTADRLRSRGRFLAVQEPFLDPAVVAAGAPLSVIGEVTGHTTRPLDDSQYSYPILDIKHLIDWNAVAAQAPQGGTVGSYAPFYYPPGYWWGPYGAYPYWAYPPILFHPPTSTLPPPSAVPPQFQKRN